MEFAKAVASVPADLLAKEMGCAVRTVYSWRSGERVPKGWIRETVFAAISRVRAKGLKAATAV